MCIHSACMKNVFDRVLTEHCFFATHTIKITKKSIFRHFSRIFLKYGATIYLKICVLVLLRSAYMLT